MFLIILKNYRLFTQCGLLYTLDWVFLSVDVKSHHLYDLAYMVQKAFDILSSAENWDLQAAYQDARLAADRGGVAFSHRLRDVQDAFGFGTGEAYREWFLTNRTLLDLYRELEEGSVNQIRGGLFSVDEDFIGLWEQAIEPERRYQAGHGWWSFQFGDGWVLDD